MSNRLFQGNSKKLWQFAAALSFLLFISFTISQAQTVVFGSYSQRSLSARNFVFDNTGSAGNPSGTFNTVALGNPVFFTYSDSITGLPQELLDPQFARIFLTSSTVSPATGPSLPASGVVDQPLTTFTLEIRRDTAFTSGAGTRRNLLTVVVTSAANISSTIGANSAAYSASQPGGQTVTFTSDFLDFSTTTARDFALNFSGANDNLSIGPGGVLNDFTIAGGGNFSSNPLPTYNPPTSSSVNVGGRVLNTFGRGIRGAQVSLTDGAGTTRTTVSNSFGYYNFSEVAAGQTVVVAVASKRYLFNSQVVSVGEELTGLNFTAIDQFQKLDY